VAPIIRTCSRLALFLGALAATAAHARKEERSALSSYVQARLADSAGKSQDALVGYSAALAAEPDNEVIAFRTFRQAVAAGDRRQAIRAAAQLDAAKALPSDARLLLFGDRVASGDVAGARLIVDRIEEEGSFAFAAPILRAWTGVAARDADPLIALDAVQRGSLASSYATEQRALLLLALKRPAEAATIVRSLAAIDGRTTALKIAAAASFTESGDRKLAAEMLTGNDQTIVAARALLDSGKPLEGSIRTAQAGTAQLFARVADDLLSDRSSAFALTMARFARFLDPRNGYVMLVEGRALASSGLNEEALAVLRSIPVSNPYAAGARDAVFVVLERTGRADEAIALVAADAAKPTATASEYVRLGEIYDRQKRYIDAANSYGAAIRLLDKSGTGSSPWALWLLHGGALEKGGEWGNAVKALRRAVDLGPDEAAPANHLGYAMLERRENVAEATRLIAKANALKPDDAAITDSLGWAYFLSGDTEKAIATLERAVAADPYEPTLSEHLGDVYWAAGRRIDARYAWRAAAVSAAPENAARLSEKIDFGLNQKNAAR
jgi:tetratricopeptide (TPR) repeat protein